jgi:queuine tRNA-ribosyltransferase
MGVGTPIDLVNAVATGIDQFDCVLPTRNARKGFAFTSAGTLRLRNARHKLADAPVDEACDCYTCRRFSRGYLRHLIMTGEVLGGTLVSLHNIRFYQTLMRQMRAAIQAGTFAAWRAAFQARHAAEDTKEDE